MDWFLYDNGLRHERVKPICLEQTDFSNLEKLLHIIVKNHFFPQKVIFFSTCYFVTSVGYAPGNYLKEN